MVELYKRQAGRIVAIESDCIGTALEDALCQIATRGPHGSDPRETAETYKDELFRLGHYRVVVCCEGMQWLYQRRRPAITAGGVAWNTLGHCTSKKKPSCGSTALTMALAPKQSANFHAYLGGEHKMTDAHDLTVALKGRWMGQAGVACCPAHGDKKPSLSIGTGRNGKLLLTCHAGCEFRDILSALRSSGLLGGTEESYRPEHIGDAALRVAERANTFRRERQARGLWEGARSPIYTIGETYLRRRGITCALPYSIRYIGDCWHPTAKRLPALIGYIRGANGFAVHRTYIKMDGSGKADVTPSKAMLGPAMGGAVRLSDGPGRLVVAEGIETALSLMSGIIEGPYSVWAALSAGGMKGLNLPKIPGQLVVAPDGDEVGLSAANALAERADILGWKVSILAPPQGLDWNDVLRGKSAA